MTRYKVSAKNNNKYSMKFRELLIDKIEQLKIKPTELSEISGVPKTCIYNFRYRINATLTFDYIVRLANALDIDLNKLKGVQKMKVFHQDYVTRIIDWAKDREIKEKGRLTKQLLKSDEENSELQNAIESYENGNKDALIQIKDSIGDIYVTLVVSTYLVSERTYLTFRKIRTSKDQTVNVSWLYTLEN